MDEELNHDRLAKIVEGMDPDRQYIMKILLDELQSLSEQIKILQDDLKG